MATRDTGIPNDVAALKGARLVHASETEEGRRLAESFVKDLTGGDTLSARFLHHEFFEFTPTLKLWLRTNHKPEIRGTDDAIWDRIRLIPFSVRITDEIPRRELDARFAAELSGILAWAIAGCQAWLRDGLGTPDEVRAATEDYRAEMDAVGAWIAECCVVAPQARSRSKDLYTGYREFAIEQGEKHILTQTTWAACLKERGFANRRKRDGVWWMGLGLRADDGRAADTDDGDADDAVPRPVKGCTGGEGL
jgi:putative DNA primase/helicase